MCPDAGSVMFGPHLYVCLQLFSPHADWFIPVAVHDEASHSGHLRAVRNAVALNLTSQAFELGSLRFPAVWLKTGQQRSATQIIQFN